MESRIIYQGHGYTACVVAKGKTLTVERESSGKGRYLSGQEAIRWIAELEESDDDEKLAICRVIYRG